jgi:aspartate dehydrogenase
MTKVGLAGCGNIGGVVARAIDESRVNATISGFYDNDEDRASQLANGLRKKAPVCTLEELVERSDLIVESTVPAAVPDIVRTCLAARKDVMCLSVGGFLGHEDLFDLARERGCHIYIPSGAIAGLDGLRAAAMGRIDKVRLTTRKPPQNLATADIVRKRGLSLEGLVGPLTIFEGPAREAVRHFPVNLNVAASLSLAGIGAEATIVKVVADPGLTSNVHEVEVEGEFGHLFVRLENVPSPDNPKTSYLAALSALALLKRITEPVQLGT